VKHRAAVAVVFSAIVTFVIASGLAVLPGTARPMVSAIPVRLAEPDLRLAEPPVPTLEPSPSPTPSSAPTTPAGSASGTSRGGAAQPPAAPAPASGVYACTGGGPGWGSGSLGWRSFQVAVETSVPVSPDDFGSWVDTTLGDSRSWARGGGYGLTHVAGCWTASFTVVLASPSTAYAMCKAGGIDIRVGGVPYTSCRVGSRVVINSDRWLKGVAGYPASLTVYRHYVINHEVGHALGFGHQNCPGSGQLAPVMQQQTLSMNGCLANSWPYPSVPPDPPPPPPPLLPVPTPTPEPTPEPTSPPEPTDPPALDGG
jgi:hypothetical protein